MEDLVPSKSLRCYSFQHQGEREKFVVEEPTNILRRPSLAQRDRQSFLARRRNEILRDTALSQSAEGSQENSGSTRAVPRPRTWRQRLAAVESTATWRPRQLHKEV